MLGSRGSPQTASPVLHFNGTHMPMSLTCWQTSFTPHQLSRYVLPFTHSRSRLPTIHSAPSEHTAPRQRPASQYKSPSHFTTSKPLSLPRQRNAVLLSMQVFASS